MIEVFLIILQSRKYRYLFKKQIFHGFCLEIFVRIAIQQGTCGQLLIPNKNLQKTLFLNLFIPKRSKNIFRFICWPTFSFNAVKTWKKTQNLILNRGRHSKVFYKKSVRSTLLLHKCFPNNFGKFLRAFILYITSSELFLNQYCCLNTKFIVNLVFFCLFHTKIKAKSNNLKPYITSNKKTALTIFADKEKETVLSNCWHNSSFFRIFEK